MSIILSGGWLYLYRRDKTNQLYAAGGIDGANIGKI
jgi:hypothetical protein